MLTPTITRSYNQSPSKEFYRNPPITLPNRHYPILPQLNDFLSQPRPQARFGDPSYGPYGDLGEIKDGSVGELKEYLAQLPPSISLEARSVFLTTLLNKFHPSALGWQYHLPALYDFGRDRHLAQDIYGGNGLYNATEEWVALAKGKYPGVRKKVELPWLAMHLRHTLLKNPQLMEAHEDIQTAIDLIQLFTPHFKRPNEDMGTYIDRMSEPYWQAHWQLQQLNLLPKLKPEPIPVLVRR